MLPRGYRVLDFKMWVDVDIFVVTCGGRSMDQMGHNSRVILLSQWSQIATSRNKASENRLCITKFGVFPLLAYPLLHYSAFNDPVEIKPLVWRRSISYFRSDGPPLGCSGLYNLLKTNGLSPLPLIWRIFNADHDELIEIYSFSKIWYPRPHLWSSNTMWAQKIKTWKSYQRDPKGCEMMKGFEIWPQNSNSITFDPFLQKKKLSKIG